MMDGPAVGDVQESGVSVAVKGLVVIVHDAYQGPDREEG